jgi:inner membrane protein
MDSVTHIVLGACIGEAMLGKKIGKKGMLYGAIAQSLPDLDVLASLWLDPVSDLLAHRGFTHSILCCVLISPLLAWLARRFHRMQHVSLVQWSLFFITELFTHIFLDAFNNYGTGWFEPFSHFRISFNALYVADPLFTIFPLGGAIVLLLLQPKSRRRRFWAKMPIVVCTFYLVLSLFNKFTVQRAVMRSLAGQHIPHERYFTTPAPLQNLLWMVVAGNDSGYHVGYRSVLDTGRQMNFRYFPTNSGYLDTIVQYQDVQHLIRFSQGFFTIEKWSDTLVFNDLRFGQIIGWQEPKERFVFHYYLTSPAGNDLVVQRGRFSKWDKKVLLRFLRRIFGN